MWRIALAMREGRTFHQECQAIYADDSMITESREQARRDNRRDINPPPLPTFAKGLEKGKDKGKRDQGKGAKSTKDRSRAYPDRWSQQPRDQSWGRGNGYRSDYRKDHYNYDYSKDSKDYKNWNNNNYQNNGKGWGSRSRSRNSW